MDKTTALLLVLAILGLLVFLFYKILKPYLLKYDSTLLFTGGIGSGKTLNSVKMAEKLYRKNYFFAYKLYNFKARFKNIFLKIARKPLIELHKRPLLYSNIPIAYKEHFWSIKRKPAHKITIEQFTNYEEIREYSIVLIDELSGFVNQFNWDNKIAQQNINEFIQYFRHLVGGYFITNAQSESDIVVQVRRKLNSCVWCRNFKTHFFKCFYTVECTTLSMSDNVSNINQTQLEEQTQHLFGILWHMNKTYCSRCYRPRRNNYFIKEEQLTPEQKQERLWDIDDLTTTKIMRVEKIVSPLDDGTTDEQKKKGLKEIKDLQHGLKAKKGESNGKE